MFWHKPALAEQPLHARIERGALVTMVGGFAACGACEALIWAGVLPAAFSSPLLLALGLTVGLSLVASAIAAACEPKPFRFMRTAARLGHVPLMVGALGRGPDAHLRFMTGFMAFFGLLGLALMGDVAHQARTRTAPWRSMIGIGAFGLGIVLIGAGGLAAAMRAHGWGWSVLAGALVVVAGLFTECVMNLRVRDS
jgi:hypothetical protein